MNEFEFLTQFARRGRSKISTCVGNPVVRQYRAVYDDVGVLRLDESGDHNLYAEIQSYESSTDLATIISRYFNGDPNALSRVQGVYADMTGMPDNVHEVYNLMAKAREDFHTLPVEIQAKFGNDPIRFLSSLGTPEWMDAMQIKSAPSQSINEKDVVADAVAHAEVVRDSEV